MNEKRGDRLVLYLWDAIGSLAERVFKIEERIKRLEDEVRPKERWHRR